MKLALFGRYLSGENKPYIAQLIQQLRQRNIEFAIEKAFYEKLLAKNKIENALPVFEAAAFSSDFSYMLSLGGDGTMLDAVAIVQQSQVPLVGVNFGRLGFLSSVGKDEIDRLLRALSDKNYLIEKHSLLQIQSSGGLFENCPFGLNEFTLQRKNISSMIHITTRVNGDVLHSYWGDGLIVSTPTGSTGYSMSCGGPVVFPGSENFVLTPIAPHNLNIRPIIVSHDSEIEIEAEGRSRKFLSTLDTRLGEVESGAVIKLGKAGFDISVLQLNKNAFINALKYKLFWSADLRS